MSRIVLRRRSRKLPVSLALALASFVSAAAPPGDAVAAPPPSVPKGTASPAVPPLDEGAELPPLARVVALARDRAPVVATRLAALRASRAGYAGARLSPLQNPYLEVTAERGGLGVTRDVAMQGVLWLPMEVGGQRGRRIAEVDALVGYADASVDQGRALASGLAVRAYGDLLVGSARLAVLGDILDLVRDEAELYRARLQAGDATRQDSSLAELELARVSLLLEEARADRIRARTDLAELTGIAFAGRVPPDGAGLTPPRPSVPGASAGSIAARTPSVLAARAEARYHAARAARFASESSGAVSLMLIGGRGDLGEARVGGGLAYTFPVLRRYQGERATADAERARAMTEADVRRRAAEARLRGLQREFEQLERAQALVETVAEPAAEAALDAAVETQRAGKGEVLRVLTARRDLALLRLRRLELAARAWDVVGEIVTITGTSP